MSASPAFGSRPEGPSKAVSHGLLGRDTHTSGLGLMPAYVVPFFADAQVCVPVVCQLRGGGLTCFPSCVSRS